MLEAMSASPDPTHRSDSPGNALLSGLAVQLVEESACELQADSGQWIEFWFISADGTTVLASAPRLEVRAGLLLKWRTHIDGRPVVTTLIVDEATYRSERRANVKLTVTGARSEPKQRRHARRRLAARATLTAVSCSAIVDGDWIPATLTDISNSGVGVTTTDARPRPGDRLRIDVHLLNARLRAEIRVARVSMRSHREAYLGCSLVDGSGDVAEQLRVILQRLDGVEERAG
jgi:PilZ domain